VSNDVEESAIKIFVRDKILPLYGAVDRQKDNLGITITDDDTSPFAAAYRIVSRSGDQIKAAFDQEDTQLLRVLLELPDRLGDHMSTVDELEMNGALPNGWGMDDDLTETLIKVQERINHFLNHYVPPGEHSKLVEFIKEKIEPVYQQGHKDVLRHRRMLTFSDRGHPVIEIEHTYDNLGVKSWLRTALYLPEREGLITDGAFCRSGWYHCQPYACT
jgi:hypothetical protein